MILHFTKLVHLWYWFVFLCTKQSNKLQKDTFYSNLSFYRIDTCSVKINTENIFDEIYFLFQVFLRFPRIKCENDFFFPKNIFLPKYQISAPLVLKFFFYFENLFFFTHCNFQFLIKEKGYIIRSDRNVLNQGKFKQSLSKNLVMRLA